MQLSMNSCHNDACTLLLLLAALPAATNEPQLLLGPSLLPLPLPLIPPIDNILALAPSPPKLAASKAAFKEEVH